MRQFFLSNVRWQNAFLRRSQKRNHERKIFLIYARSIQRKANMQGT